jgi:putative phage-type endonuclease
MELMNFLQGSPEWLQYRRNKFNASDAPAMMGVSPYKSRAELLRELHTGVAQHVDAGTQKRFDNGHRAEALARPLAEEFIGAELFPVTASSGRLSSSFDGLTMDETISFEHKALNNELRKCFAQMETIAPAHRERADGSELPIYHRVQMEQQLLISGAERVLFMASQWDADGELVEEQHCWYYPDLALRAEVVAGWAQFEKDLAEYAMPEAAAPAPAGKAPESLPALMIEVTGKVTASNLVEFKKTALTAIQSVNRDLKTDQDFADAAKAVKWCADIEERLQAAKQHALSQTASIDALFKTMDDISAEAKRVRLDLNGLVTRRKTEVKEEAVVAARNALAAHYAALNSELAPAFLSAPLTDFAGAIKGLRSFDSMQDALDTLLAKSKITADTAARGIRTNLAAYKEQATGFEFLFADRGQLLHKAADDFALVMRSRIDAHKAAEAKKEEDARERIRAEEAAKLQAEAATNIPAQDSQQVLKAEAATPDATGRDVPASTSPVGGPMGAGQPAAAGPTVGLGSFRAIHPAAAALRNEKPTLKLGEICTRLGFVVGAEFLAVLGFDARKERGACLYREGDFKAICAGISAHVLAVGAEVAQAA